LHLTLVNQISTLGFAMMLRYQSETIPKPTIQYITLSKWHSSQECGI
jgi:hypothetical protein